MSGVLVDVDEFSPVAPDESILFRPLDTESGLRVVDPVERRQYTLSTPTSVAPDPVDPGRFPAPVDAAVRITASEVTLPQRESVYVRDMSGEPVMHTYDTTRSCPDGRYLIDITTPVKLYLSIEAPVTVTPMSGSTTVGFDGPTTIHIGARSPHRRPRGTITTTADIDDLRAAVSALSSALKTMSPERSYPTLRGHPPRIELADERSVPSALTSAATGVKVEVSRSLKDLLVAAPLAFYLGAELAWGDRRIVTETGFVHLLSDRQDFETGVEHALKQTFLLDCLTRSEGRYPVDLYERQAFESRTDGQFDFARLYDQPIAQRLETYLGVPFRTIADLVPAWSASTYVQPKPEAITYLPYLLDTLSTIRITGPRRLEDIRGRGRPIATAERRDAKKRRHRQPHRHCRAAPRAARP